MTLQEIQNAVNQGKTVHWVNDGYIVIKDCLGQWLVTFPANGYATGLTDKANNLIGNTFDYYIGN